VFTLLRRAIHLNKKAMLSMAFLAKGLINNPLFYVYSPGRVISADALLFIATFGAVLAVVFA